MPNALNSNDDRSIVLTRIVNAPRDTVWKMWSERKHLEQWWGPDGFSVTTESFDFRVGGAWKFVMHGPDGRDYKDLIVFTDIKKPEYIAHRHSGDDGDGGESEFLATITFEEEGNSTKVTMCSIFKTPEERERVVKEYGAIEGGKQTLGRLAAYAETAV